MAFTVYSWLDSSAPQLDGTTGSLLAILDAVLVNGYGSKPGAGWTKPLPNTSSYGMYKLGNGSTSSLFVYDAGSGSAGGSEVQATGWDSITNIVGGAVTGSNPFPTYTQLGIGGGKGGSAGAVIIKKSDVTSSVQKMWTAFADSASLYLFTRPAGAFFSNQYCGFFFGDIYSLRTGSIDSSRCIIIGRSTASSSNGAQSGVDNLDAVNAASNGLGAGAVLNGHFAAHTFNGSGASITLAKHGDGNKTGQNTTVLAGVVPFLNGCDNAMYVSPVWVVETATSTIRGRMRGFWQFCHVSASQFDGQIFSGSMDFPNKIFQMVIPTPNIGTYLMEISNTLETNSP